MILYGIPNCDTVKKAREWLDAHGLAYELHDYKKRGLDGGRLRTWVDELGWEALINRRGTSWRKLDPALRDAVDEATAIRIMLENPSIIRRPVLDTGDGLLVGFAEDVYSGLLSRRPAP
jgi:Spx/MgsR family transcriptional regulator